MELDEALRAIRHEYSCAARYFPPFRSPHEGYAIIEEELDELWEAIKEKRSRTRAHHKKRMKDECTQLGAMVLRFLVDITR